MSRVAIARSLTVLVATPEDRASDLGARLRALGLQAIEMPTVRIRPPVDLRPLDRALQAKIPYDWVIFTSARAVEAVRTRAAALGVEARNIAHRAAAVGPATAKAVRALGLPVNFVPNRYLTDAIPEGLGDLRGRRVLLPRSNLARRSLPEALERTGADVTEVTAYRLAAAPPAATFDISAVDIVAFTSASSARFLVSNLGAEPSRALIARAVAACIGPVTAEAARELGFAVRVVAEEHTVDGLLAAILREANPLG